MSGDFYLEAGQIFQILVGQMGQYDYNNGSGGGGTFVVDSENNPLIISGGGGGSTRYYNGYDAVTSECASSTCFYGISQCDGNGGYNDCNDYGGPGGGFYNDGGPYSSQQNGKSFLNGGYGGDSYCGSEHDGGFGGGGGICSNWVNAGGGGYSGGDGYCSSSCGGGGGGSYNSGENQDNISGVNEGHGQVAITYQGATDWVIALPGFRQSCRNRHHRHHS
jgi:hypothetical protein